MSVQAADALMAVFGFKRQTVMVYELSRGDRFTVDGSLEVLTFWEMDYDDYGFAFNHDGKSLRISGLVTLAK